MQDVEQRCGKILGWVSNGNRLEATHERGITRVELIAAEFFRVRFSPSCVFKQSRSWSVIQPLSCNETLVTRESGHGLVARGPRHAIHLDSNTGCLRICDSRDHSFAEDIAAPAWRDITLTDTAIEAQNGDQLPAGAASQALSVTKRILPEESHYGFGQRTAKLNRRHQRFSNWTVDPSLHGGAHGHQNMYHAHPFFMSIRPGLAWGLFLNSTWYSEFDVGASQEDQLEILTLGEELDYYIFTGPTPAAVVEQLTRLTGRPLLPPLWAMGFHQSRWSYGSDDAVQKIADTFRARQIPLDVIHLDIDYMDSYRNFTWDPTRFTDPKKTLNTLHAHNIKTVTIVDPGIKLGGRYATSDDGLAKDVFIKQRDGQLFEGFCWPGKVAFPDFTRSDVRHWWGEQHRDLLKAGVDGIWIDMNEPAIFDRSITGHGVRTYPIPLNARQGSRDESTCHAEVHNLYGLLMARATYDALTRLAPNKRPWVLTRSAFTGTQTYAASWMGDNTSRWQDLEMSLAQLASIGLCGMPHVGVDIGGFYGHSHGELFARWIALGAFFPFMRCHTATGTRPQEPWSFGEEIETIAKKSIELRYRLLPYLYTLAHIAHKTGAPLLRPLFYEFPEQPSLHPIEDQLMVGSQLMIAPVVHPGITRRLVELPKGVWYDFWTGKKCNKGPLIYDAPLDTIPIFVRGGSLLPLGNVRQSTSEPLTELTLAAYPTDSGSWTLIEDDGDSNAYQNSGTAKTTYRCESKDSCTTVFIETRNGHYQPHPRRLTVRTHLEARPHRIILDDTNVDHWYWDETDHSISVSFEDDGQEHRVVIR